MNPYSERLYRGLSCAAWAYFFLYFNINLNSLNLLPDFVCYVLLWQAIGCLEEEERDLPLLRPLCLLLGVWAGADWVFTIFEGTLDGRFPPVDLFLSVASIYFHFQLFTDLSHMAGRFQPEGETLDRRLRRLRSLNTLLLTLFSVLDSLLPAGEQVILPWSAPAGWLLLGGVLTGLVVALMLMFSLFTLRRYVRQAPETPEQ